MSPPLAGLVVQLFYGSGLRFLEILRLRVKDVAPPRKTHSARPEPPRAMRARNSSFPTTRPLRDPEGEEGRHQLRGPPRRTRREATSGGRAVADERGEGLELVGQRIVRVRVAHEVSDLGRGPHIPD